MLMSNRDFEFQQMLTAYRKGLISERLFQDQLDELCAGPNGNRPAKGDGRATASSQRPARPRPITGDAGLDAPGALARIARGGSYDRSIEDLGNIVALEHVNTTVPNQEQAVTFYVAGLGLTRDPYMMTGPANMWINAGRQQFHLPTSKPQVLRGHVGLVAADFEGLPKRLTHVREGLADTRFDFCEGDGYLDAVSPWGNRIRCYPPQARFGAIALGIAYVEFEVPTASAFGISRFYTDVMGAQAALREDERGRFACVTVGAGQNLYFRETDRPMPPYDQHHVAIYINDFSSPYRKLAARRLITQESDQHQFRFQDLVDPESGKVLFTIEHEVRSMRHPMYLRALVNRNPSQSILRYAPGADAINWATRSN